MKVKRRIKIDDRISIINLLLINEQDIQDTSCVVISTSPLIVQNNRNREFAVKRSFIKLLTRNNRKVADEKVLVRETDTSN